MLTQPHASYMFNHQPLCFYAVQQKEIKQKLTLFVLISQIGNGEVEIASDSLGSPEPHY